MTRIGSLLGVNTGRVQSQYLTVKDSRMTDADWMSYQRKVTILTTYDSGKNIPENLQTSFDKHMITTEGLNEWITWLRQSLEIGPNIEE